MKPDIEKCKYEFAKQRIDILLPLVKDNMESVISPAGVELMIMSDIVEAYEKKYYQIGRGDVTRTHDPLVPNQMR